MCEILLRIILVLSLLATVYTTFLGIFVAVLICIVAFSNNPELVTFAAQPMFGMPLELNMLACVIIESIVYTAYNVAFDEYYGIYTWEGILDYILDK